MAFSWPHTGLTYFWQISAAYLRICRWCERRHFGKRREGKKNIKIPGYVLTEPQCHPSGNKKDSRGAWRNQDSCWAISTVSHLSPLPVSSHLLMVWSVPNIVVNSGSRKPQKKATVSFQHSWLQRIAGQPCFEFSISSADTELVGSNLLPGILLTVGMTHLVLKTWGQRKWLEEGDWHVPKVSSYPSSLTHTHPPSHNCRVSMRET